MDGQSPNARLKLLFGRPILSRIVSSSPGAITLRISFSMLAKIISVLSIRVPAGARACSRICPESTAGKKSLPTS